MGLRSATLAAGALCVLVAVAGASAITFPNPGPITINDSGLCGNFVSSGASIAINDSESTPTRATPYPAQIVVSDVVGTITDVNVHLGGFVHNFPDDVDVLLVGPNGSTSVLLMSDTGGGSPVSGLDLTFDDEAGSPLPDNGALTSGTFLPTNYEAGVDGFPSPAPAGTHGTALTAFDGVSPNGTWSLYVVDDVFFFSGAISNWSLEITVSVSSCQAPASPYPSTIEVSGLFGTVSDANVTLEGFSHAFPDDADVLLVGPSGASAILLSDVGGSDPANNRSIQLDDEAAGSLPDSGPLVNGSFKPTNFGAGDVFPLPAPAGPYGNALTTFDSTVPNGTWSLYVVDDVYTNAGSIDGGWALELAGPTAVLVPRFTASSGRRGVVLRWWTTAETEIAGFRLTRSSPGGPSVRLNRKVINARSPGTARGATYRFLDRSARNGAVYTYRLELVHLNGTRSLARSVTVA